MLDQVWNQISRDLFWSYPRKDIPIQVWHIVEVLRRDLNEHLMTEVPKTVNQLVEKQTMEEVPEHVGLNYTHIPGFRYVAKPDDDFLFPREEMGTAENSIIVDKDGGFSETVTPPAPQQPLQPRAALRSIENLQHSRQLFD